MNSDSNDNIQRYLDGLTRLDQLVFQMEDMTKIISLITELDCLWNSFSEQERQNIEAKYGWAATQGSVYG